MTAGRHRKKKRHALLLIPLLLSGLAFGLDRDAPPQPPRQPAAAALTLPVQEPPRQSSPRQEAAESLPRHYPVYTVRAGDTLSEIALRECGSLADWTTLWHANETTIGTIPGSIYPGQKLILTCRRAA